MTLATLSALFLLPCAAMAVTVTAVFVRYLSGQGRTLALGAFAVWLLYAGGVGYSGLVASRMPPGPVFLMGPAIMFAILYLARNATVGAFARRLPPALPIKRRTHGHALNDRREGDHGEGDSHDLVPHREDRRRLRLRGHQRDIRDWL